MRKGKIGSYKEDLDLDIIEELNAWSNEILASKNLTEKEILTYKKYQ